IQYCTRASLKRRSTSCTKGIAGSGPGAGPPPVLETSNSRIHTMFVGQTVCESYGIRLDGHVKQESRQATPESVKQTWRSCRSEPLTPGHIQPTSKVAWDFFTTETMLS